MHKVISEYDTYELESILHGLLSKHPIETITANLIIPVLTKLDFFAKHTPESSSKISFFRVFILYRLGGLCLKTNVKNNGSKILLMGLNDQYCNVQMLLFSMPLLQHGYKIITMGCDIPLDIIPQSLLASKAEGVLIYADVNHSNQGTAKTLQSIVDSVDKPIYISSQNSKHQKMHLQESGVVVLPDSTDSICKIIDESINKSTK